MGRYYILSSSMNNAGQIVDVDFRLKKNANVYLKYVGYEQKFNFRANCFQEADSSIMICGNGFWLKIKQLPFIYSDKDMILALGGPVNSYFIQSQNIGSFPEEGWKLHITAYSEYEYHDILANLVPQLIQNNVLFKVARPSMAKYFLNRNNAQVGKLITIYLTNPKNQLHFLSPEARQCLMNGGIPVTGELHIGGNIYARYGAFVGHQIYNPYTRNFVQDIKGIECPYWIFPIQANNIF